MSQSKKQAVCSLCVLFFAGKVRYDLIRKEDAIMDQVKIGSFLKALRNEKGLTQEQLAEQVNVSRRSVSRWETGSNLPDLDVLMELADYYGVELRELLDGERKSEQMDQVLKETTLKVAEYSNEEKKRITKTVLVYLTIGIVALIVSTALDFMELEDGFWLGFLDGACTGILFWALMMGILYASGSLTKVQTFKRRLLGRKEAAI